MTGIGLSSITRRNRDVLLPKHISLYDSDTDHNYAECLEGMERYSVRLTPSDAHELARSKRTYAICDVQAVSRAQYYHSKDPWFYVRKTRQTGSLLRVCQVSRSYQCRIPENTSWFA